MQALLPHYSHRRCQSQQPTVRRRADRRPAQSDGRLALSIAVPLSEVATDRERTSRSFAAEPASQPARNKRPSPFYRWDCGVLGLIHTSGGLLVLLLFFSEVGPTSLPVYNRNPLCCVATCISHCHHVSQTDRSGGLSFVLPEHH